MEVDVRVSYHSLLGGILTARSETLPPQWTDLTIRPARIPARSPHQLALAAGAARKVESGCEV